ncbi:uncharacterized protein FOMMEDRAFT_17928 [Fomitiporia mediterranea MF3/22]|uniref:uncharacterized protein n=1 Tax=Fomitiporia mediterranea (strain MF3/22) TaxID=694068 RepID=UPI0004408D72|nr:uncharacterized protein FOMMEDRAFT_17928 [Fomitiporia mediterranea MF3/22]EJD05676.1 hypothetical protein FOMMEDRAFT_17928 [Fomitiporia mediterranea MF3/22]
MIGTNFESCKSARTVPSLVYICQRVLGANIDRIVSFGDEVPYRLIGPILQGCTADTLLRLEQETPHLHECTLELWKDICVRTYPTAVDQVLSTPGDEPESWRDFYVCTREREIRRFEEAANKLRSQRIEAEEMKRKRQVKLTDRLPPTKRPRTGCMSASLTSGFSICFSSHACFHMCTGLKVALPPKTLLEKTRKEATKFQRSVLGPPTLPPAGNSKGFRAKIGAPCAQFTEKDESRVKINTIVVRNSSPPNLLLPSSQALHKPEPTTRTSRLSQSRPNR